MFRYGRALNKQLLGANQRKFLAATSAGASLAELQSKVQGASAGSEARLSGRALQDLLRHGRAALQEYYQLTMQISQGNPGVVVHMAAR